MMYAYDINLFSKAQLSLASMFEYAVNACRTFVEGTALRYRDAAGTVTLRTTKNNCR